MQDPDSDDVLLVEWPDPSDVLTGWRAARGVMSLTGRRAVAVDGEEDVNWFGEVDSAELAELETASRELDPWRERNRWRGAEPEEPVDLDQVKSFLDFWPMGPEWDVEAAAREVLPGLPSVATSEALQRHLLDRITGDAPLATRFRSASSPQKPEALGWYVPQRAQFALLPTTSAWLSMAWLDYFGEENKAVLAAALRQWHEKWGAEIVASWGTMMQFVATRRPEFGPDALNLAYQQLSLAGNIDISEIDLAWILSHVNTWFLHERP
ncbi:hypothetical protein Kisp02_57170 [Kineosporia sp. NBRC 101731]|nr:hypothetical protein Kisp02_57170 [Kineosporia sp. NBRC 101731]